MVKNETTSVAKVGILLAAGTTLQSWEQRRKQAAQ